MCFGKYSHIYFLNKIEVNWKNKRNLKIFFNIHIIKFELHLFETMLYLKYYNYIFLFINTKRVSLRIDNKVQSLFHVLPETMLSASLCFI